MTIKEAVNNGIRGLMETLGFIINPLLISISGENSQLLVFYFHGLYKSPEEKDLNHIDPQKNMTVSQFSKFVKYFLDHKYIFIKPEDLLTGLDMNKRYAMITFDDGYYNNMLALPILERFKIPAVFFVTGENVKENRVFWWDVIYKYRIKQGVNALKIQLEQEQLKSFKHGDINNYIRKTFGEESFKSWSDIDRPLTKEEVKILSNSPYAIIGNHTYHHALLPNYDKNEMEEEIALSNEFLKSLTGTIPTSIAFPNGYYNKIVLNVAKEAGFLVAFSAVPDKNYLPINNRNIICLNRFMSNNNNIRYYGSFFRLGYTPGSLFSKIKASISPGYKQKYNSEIDNNDSF